jgi:exopolysaccharide biosynthesis protein
MAYIGIIRGASVATAAKVLVAMGIEHAMNLDSGGSTALWVNGSYKAGPGRDIPNAIVFVRK